MSDAGRCGAGTCRTSTSVLFFHYNHRIPNIKKQRSVTPAIVYFPAGTYVVSKAITPYYYTQVIGDARNPPTLQASAGFTGFAIIGEELTTYILSTTY